MTTVFIVNPEAGRGLTRDQWPKLEKTISKEHEVIWTKAPGHATELAREAASHGAARVVAVGGDGTATEVAVGLRDTPAVMGHVPMGAGCDFARGFGIPRDPATALAALDTLQETVVDLGLSDDGQGFLTISGAGFDAEVAAEDAKSRSEGMRGALPYLKAILKVLLSYHPTPVRLTLDGGQAIETKALLIAVANSQYYAGGMRVAPYASPTDGLLDVVVIGDLSTVGTLGLLPKAFSGAHRTHSKVTFHRAQSVKVESDRPLMCHLNGEAAHTTPMTFSLAPASLRLLAGTIPEAMPGAG